jgi:hypothetical protein
LRNLALILLLGLVASACGDLPRPFQPEYKDDGNFSMMPVDKAGMVVRPVDGLPPAAAEAFTRALIDALRREDVAAMAAPGNRASLVLAGAAVGDSSGWDITLALGDPQQKRLGEVMSHASPAVADDPKAWDSYAAALARSVVGILQSDPTLRPGNAPVVGVAPIAGLDGPEARALVRALEYTLRRAHIQLADGSDKATHVVGAEVALGPKRGPAGREVRSIEVVWTVRRANGSEIGQIRQANDVPIAILEAEWPDVALAVADAAAGSIIDLVNRQSAATR